MTKGGADGRRTVDEGGAPRAPQEAEGPPPFAGSWRAIYAAVLVNLAVLVLLFHLFTRYFG